MPRQVKVITFPDSEAAALRARLAKGLPVYTTRVSAEQGRYTKGEILRSMLGRRRLRVESVRTLPSVDAHPFKDELTDGQIAELEAHGPPFDLVKLRLAAGRAPHTRADNTKGAAK